MTKTSTPKQPSAMASALLERAQAYATLIGRELSTVSVYLFNDGKVLKSIQSGGDIYTRQYERGVAELDRRVAKLTAPAQPVVAAKPPAAAKVAPKKAAPPKKAAAKKAPVKTAKVAPPPKLIQQPGTAAMQQRAKAAPRVTKPAPKA